MTARNSKGDVKDLTREERAWLVSQIEHLLGDRSKNRFEPWINVLLDSLLWFWSVDGMVGGEIKRNAIARRAKNGIERASSTLAARNAARSPERAIQRDHVVPKKELIRLLWGTKTRQQVVGILEKYCFVAYVHTKEHKDHLAKQTMPRDWTNGGDPWARYEPLLRGLQPHPSAPRPLKAGPVDP